MSDKRATKSGFALEAQKTMEGKFNIDDARKCMEWIKETLGLDSIDTSGDPSSVHETLKDGIILTKLYKAIDPHCNLKVDEQKKMAFVQMGRIEKFNELIKGKPLEVPQHATFQTVDLFESQNMSQVIICLTTVARKCHTANTPVKGFGPMETAANKREFTEEQLAQGKTVIGLQMGSNKGASQAGQNFGKTRKITD